MAICGRIRFFSFAILPLAITTGVLVFSVSDANAAVVKKTSANITTKRTNEIKIGDSDSFPIYGKFLGGATVAAGDVNGDGVDEYITGAGPTGGPHVLVLNQSGSTIGSFFAYDKKNIDGINVAAGDLTGDGVAEIVTGSQAGAKPEVRVFSIDGTLLAKFNAFESGFRGGVQVAVIPARGGAFGSIVTGSGFGREAEVRIYDHLGTGVSNSWLPFGKRSSNGVSVGAGWSDTFGQDIIVVGAGAGEKPLVQVYSLRAEKLAQWLAYDRQVKTGIAVGYRAEHVITGPGAGGGPDRRIFTVRGGLISSALVFENYFRGGINVALAQIGGAIVSLAVPTTSSMTAASSGKRITVSLSKQEMTLYEKGRVVAIRKISSGKWSMPTPTGEFTVRNKIPVAYSKAYGLYMENWMAFSPDGQYGLHSLPYWKLSNGGKLYEGAAHIGTPVSHGCVRQTLADSKTLFDWAPVGTPISIRT